MLPKAFKAPRVLTHHWVAKGCDHCFYTGYKGRKAVYEIIPIDSDIAECIRTNRHDINEKLKERGIVTLAESAFELLESGNTSLEEVYSLMMN